MIKDNTDTYIRHTAAHELFHNLHLRYLNLEDRTDQRTYDNIGAHYKETLPTIMAERVLGSTKKAGDPQYRN